MLKKINKQLLLSALAAMLPIAVFAADGQEGSNINMLLIALISFIFILLFAILLLGNTLLSLGFAYRDKLRKKRTEASGVVKTLLLLIGAVMLAGNVHAQDAAQATSSAPVVIAGMLADEFYWLISVIVLELAVIFTLIILIKRMINLISDKEAKEAAKPNVKRRSFWDRINDAKPIEKEEDILLDHDYDGIRELDNSLPPWWKWGFYLTIVIGIIYLWYYHGGGNGPSSREEYIAEVEKGEREVAKYLANSANNVDENSVVMLEGADIAAGRTIFENTCSPCHAKDGGGNTIGPNLTDQYWLHGGSIKHIFKSIKYGWPDKGMKSWKDDFSPKQIAQLASFVKSLQGTTPAAPKEKQGELYIEAETTTDSTATDTEQTN